MEEDKFLKLKEYLISLGSAAVAFSGGVDSAFLLKAAHDVLGDRAFAVTARSCSFPARELNDAAAFCEKEKIRQIIIDSDELDAEGFRENPADRCYICKKHLFTKIRLIAAENGADHVLEGSNADDIGDYRPGLRAVAELGIKSPLMEAGLDKSDIRRLSKQLGLPTWNKQSFACLASRIPYGEIISEEKLAMADKAEQFLLDRGFHQVRVRIHGGSIARIEIFPEEFPKLIDIRDETVSFFKKVGFSYVSMDLQGYRTGSMNETILI